MASLATLSACGDVAQQGTGSSYLIVSALEGASGAEPGEFGTNLSSDVITVVNSVPTVFSDVGRGLVHAGDEGSRPAEPNPTTANFITINRYHVRYFRADGRNTPGVDVPYAFDGALTVTVTGNATAGFELVRVHREERGAAGGRSARNFVVISTIAEVTFYGRDRAGRDVSVTARMGDQFRQLRRSGLIVAAD